MDAGAVMRHLRNDDNIESWVCQFCGEPFPYDVHPEAIRHHLIWKCERAPEDVKEAAQRIEEDDFSISVEGNGSNFNAQTECSRNAEREVEAGECSISVNWEPTRIILDASENSDSNSDAEIESNIVQRSNKLPIAAALEILAGPWNAGREVEAGECSISVNWEPTRILLDASENEAEIVAVLEVPKYSFGDDKSRPS